MSEEHVVLVDESDNEIGSAERWYAHKEGQLHRAVSVFVFNESGKILLQRRATTKPIFGGLWANTCCTHPRPGEDVTEAGKRRLQEEMGLDVEVCVIGTFIYRATDAASGYREHELDHVLIGTAAVDPEPDPGEADDYRWIDIAELRADLILSDRYVPWLKPALETIPGI